MEEFRYDEDSLDEARRIAFREKTLQAYEPVSFCAAALCVFYDFETTQQRGGAAVTGGGVRG